METINALLIIIEGRISELEIIAEIKALDSKEQKELSALDDIICFIKKRKGE